MSVADREPPIDDRPSEWADFIDERTRLLEPKPGQSASALAEDLVRLMEILSIHGASGIEADPDTRRAYVNTLVTRIVVVRLETEP